MSNDSLLLKTLKLVRIPIYYYRLSDPVGFEFISDEITNLIGFTPHEHYENPSLGQELVIAEDKHILKQISSPDYDLSKPVLLRWKRKDGSILWTEQLLTPDFIDGVLVGLIGVIKDVTKEKELKDLAQTLQLPVCSWCNKVNVNENKWISITDYLMLKNQRVTHGICKDCSIKHFP
jgi:hypothetical protein